MRKKKNVSPLPSSIGMTGCEVIKCSDYREGMCWNVLEYVNAETGENMCPKNGSAIPREDYEEAAREAK